MLKYDFAVIDIETLGTSVDSVILSFAIYAVNLQEHVSQMWFCNIDAVEQEQRGRSVCKDTEKWWKDNMETTVGRDAWDINMCCPATMNRAKDVLMEAFADIGDVPFYGCGPDFDLAIIEHFLSTHFQLKPGYSFRNRRCYRTLRELYKPYIQNYRFVGTPHTATADALNEGEILRFIHTCIKYDGRKNIPVGEVYRLGLQQFMEPARQG